MTESAAPVLPQPLAKVGGRKFVLTAFVVVAAFAFRALELFDNTTTVQMVSMALGFFSAANVAQKFKGSP